MKRTLVVMPGHDFDGSGGFSSAGAAPGGIPPERLREVVLRDTVAFAELLHQTPGGVAPELVMAYVGERLWYEQRTSGHWLLVPRMGANLAQCLDNLLISLDARPDDQTVFMGAGTPHLQPRALHEAFITLGQRQAVVGPCEGGGLYMMGAQGRWPCGILANVRWTAPQAQQDLLKIFRRSRVSVGLLDELYRLESEADLRRLADDFGVYPDRALGNIRLLLDKTGKEPTEPV
ncbi:MAG: DUF2064 domain-containing protein [Armatimonadota bacterium]